MKVIHKQELPIQDKVTLEFPSLPNIIAIDTQRGVPCIWYEIFTENVDNCIIDFYVVGTGNPLPKNANVHAATVLTDNDNLVWHIYTEYPF